MRGVAMRFTNWRLPEQPQDKSIAMALGKT